MKICVVRNSSFWTKGRLTSNKGRLPTTFVWSQPTFDPERWVPNNSGMGGLLGGCLGPRTSYVTYVASAPPPWCLQPPNTSDAPKTSDAAPCLMVAYVTQAHILVTLLDGCLHTQSIFFSYLLGWLPMSPGYLHRLPCWMVAYVIRAPCLGAWVLSFPTTNQFSPIM